MANVGGRKDNIANKVSLRVDPEVIPDGGIRSSAIPAPRKRPSLNDTGATGTGAASRVTRSGKNLWALESVKDLAPVTTKKRSMFMTAYKSMKRAAGIPSKKNKNIRKKAEKTSSGASGLLSKLKANSETGKTGGESENDTNAMSMATGTSNSSISGSKNVIGRINTEKLLTGIRGADGNADRAVTHKAYLDALRQALPHDVQSAGEGNGGGVGSLSGGPSRSTSLSDSINGTLPDAPKPETPLSPRRVTFKNIISDLVRDMKRRHESTSATARGMLKSLTALEELEPAAVAFGRVQRRADASFWSSLPPTQMPSLPEREESSYGTSIKKSDGRIGRQPQLTLKHQTLLTPRRKPPSPGAVEARYKGLEDLAEKEVEGLQSEFAFFPDQREKESRSVSAPASPSRQMHAVPTTRSSSPAERSYEQTVSLQIIKDGFDAGLSSVRKGNKIPNPERNPERNLGPSPSPSTTAAAIAEAASRVKLPLSISRRLAAVQSASDFDSSPENSPLPKTWVTGHGGSRFRVNAHKDDETERDDGTPSAAAATLAQRARQAAHATRRQSFPSVTNETKKHPPSSVEKVLDTAPERRAGDLDQLRAMRRRLQHEYEEEARGILLMKHAQKVDYDETAERNGFDTNKGYRATPKVLDEKRNSPKKQASSPMTNQSAYNRNPSEEEVWHHLARLGGFDSFEDVPSSAKPLNVSTARLRAAYAMDEAKIEIENENGNTLAGDNNVVASPGFRGVMGSPTTAKAGFDALSRRRDARRAAKERNEKKPMWAGGR